MRVVITGARGQLGTALVAAYAGHEVVGLGHDELDVTDEARVTALLADLEPDLVVHSAAWTDVDGCEDDPDRAHAANALGAWWVARACRLVGAWMVLVSTDYVFDGTADRPYTEFDAVAPLSVYGRSKAAAEQLVRSTLDEHQIVRTAWLLGSTGRNVVRAVLDQAARGQRLRYVADVRGSPTAVPDLAVAVRELSLSGRPGVWHRTSGGSASWFEIAVATVELAGLDVDVEPIPAAARDQRAPRPARSVLSNRHAELAGFSPIPHWRDGLRRVLEELGV